MQLQKILSKNVIDAFDKLFSVEVENIEFQPTKKEFEGDITIVIFPFVKILKLEYSLILIFYMLLIFFPLVLVITVM